ncbi:hypothetical protein OGY35_04815 [Citrobacter sp. Ct235]|uniref:hypothetical protein n=1 Tax=Citrobacter sp. Ct235 TaxID=2985157 RepID=UPI002577D6B5|nr:hypothetical protein [Citrobacter sp. Ct235]MDM2734693.1 hypothetical protein [Citrobacter sp. Ct235]
MAILGHFFTRFPLFFESGLTVLKTLVEIFTDTAGNVRIYVLLFYRVVGIKRGARLISVILQVACALASSFAPVTYSCKLPGTHCVVAFLQLELFWIDKKHTTFSSCRHFQPG